ncbi:MAG: T9SS type A sorting domain-containing protein [Bacteroidia bacterium]|nr:T9SS type A sorting domain-containing protein [Bacteroidia bacterium]MDW8348562.1 T9SS type A sorting domain-containing protein [Bacteroidia bacterium]
MYKKTFILFSSILSVYLVHAQISVTKLWSMKANPTLNSINGVAFKADGQKVISGTNCHPASIRMFDSNTGNLDWDYTVGSAFMCIMGVTFSGSGNYIAAVEEFGNILIFDNTGATPVIVDTIKTLTSYAFSIAFSPDNSKVAVGCSSNRLKIYNIPGGTLAHNIVAHTGWVTAVAYSPDGTKIVTGGTDDKVKIWTSTGTLLHTLSGHTGDITSVKFSPDNTKIVSASKDDKIRIWDANTGTLIKVTNAHNKDVNGIDVSPDGTKIVSVSADSTGKIWDFATGNLLYTFGVSDSGVVNAVAWSPLGDKIVTGSAKSDVVMWKVTVSSNIDDSNILSAWSIYPNPAQNTIQVTLPTLLKNAKLAIHNLLGELVQSYEINSIHNDLDISYLPHGLYLCTLEYHQNRVSRKLFIQR